MEKNGFRLRNYTPDDKGTILAISAAADEVDRVERRMMPAELEEWLTIPGVQPCSDVFIAEADGRPVGYAGFDVLVGSLERHVAFVGGEVHPAFRRRGIGTALMAAAEARAAQVMDGLPDGMQRHLESFCRSVQDRAVALLCSRQMSPVRYFWTMQRPLHGDLPAPCPPAGLEIRAFREEDDEAARQAFDEAFRDHWGYEPVTPEEWGHFMRGVPHFRPELWFLAWDGDEIAGFTLNFVNPEFIAQVGRQEGKVAEVGVRRRWRRRGLATALLAHSLRALREAGMDTAMLGVDSENPHQAMELYERLGFRTRWKNVVYRKVI